MSEFQMIKDLKLMQKIDRYLLLKPFLVTLKDGRFFKTFAVVALRLIALFFTIGFIGLWFYSWKGISSLSGIGSLIMVLVIFQLLAIPIAYAIVNIILVRASDIESLESCKDYVVIPIVVVIIKLVGELFSLSVFCIGLLFFAVSLTPDGSYLLSALSFIPDLPGVSDSSGFFGLLVNVLVSVIILFSTYFVAEQLGALIDIAKNTRK